MPVLKTLLVFGLGFIPPLLSVLLLRRFQHQAQLRLRRAIASLPSQQLQLSPLPDECYYLEGVGYYIGNITCRFNAHSAQIRCAVNPSGPCHTCSHYESIDFD